MKKTTILYIIALIAAGITSGACTAYGWHSHEEYVEKMKLI